MYMKIRNNEDAKASQVDLLGSVNGLLTAQFDWIENQSEEVQDLFNDCIVAHRGAWIAHIIYLNKNRGIYSPL